MFSSWIWALMPFLPGEQADSGNPGSLCGPGRGSRWWCVSFHQITWLSPVGSHCSHPNVRACWQRPPCPLGKGEERPVVSLQGPGFVSRRMGPGLLLHYWACTGLVRTLTLSGVAESNSSTVASSELSSSLQVSHPPTLAASSLQTDLLVK